MNVLISALEDDATELLPDLESIYKDLLIAKREIFTWLCRAAVCGFYRRAGKAPSHDTGLVAAGMLGGVHCVIRTNQHGPQVV